MGELEMAGAPASLAPDYPPMGSAAPARPAEGVDPADASTWARTPRNAPCPCGSGRKYKHCHGRVD